MKNTTETTGIKIDSDVKKLLADGARFAGSYRLNIKPPS